MNWKEFLKPSKKKIAIFIVTIILSFLYRTPPYDSLLIFTYILNLPILFLDYLSNIFNIFGNLPSEKFEILVTLIFFILTFFYWYLLSCLIVWIYDKLKKKISRWYLLAIGVFAVILLILVIFVCPPGWIESKDCAMKGYKLTCYKPMEDAGKECASASDCKGACTTNFIDRCKKINLGFHPTTILAICDSDIKGECSPYRAVDSVNNLLNYSDIPWYVMDELTDYNLTENNKIIVREGLLCY
jgi:hypothetical protein